VLKFLEMPLCSQSILGIQQDQKKLELGKLISAKFPAMRRE
jgi:hypothetical protein